MSHHCGWCGKWGHTIRNCPDVDERIGPAPVRFDARVRIDTPREAEYFRHGGILQYVLRALLAR